MRNDKKNRTKHLTHNRGKTKQGHAHVYIDIFIVYCRSTACSVVSTSADRRKILAQKKLCYNCTGSSHRAAECRSTTTCRNCSKRHYTSICESETKRESLQSIRQASDCEVIYPVVLLKVDGIKTRALLDTGAGSSYASAKLIDALHKQPAETKTKRIEMVLGYTTTKVAWW